MQAREKFRVKLEGKQNFAQKSGGIRDKVNLQFAENSKEIRFDEFLGNPQKNFFRETGNRVKFHAGRIGFLKFFRQT